MAAHRDARLGLITAPILAGVERLWANRNLLINGVEVAPALWFDGTGLDDSAKTWTCRQTGTVLSEAGSGSSPDLAQYGPHLGEMGAKGEGGKALQPTLPTFGDIETEDIVFEAALEFTGAVNDHVFGKLDEVGGHHGYALYTTASSLTLRIVDSGGGANVFSPTLSAGAKYHLFVCVNRDENSANCAIIHVNGVAGSGADLSAISGSLSSSDKFTLLDLTTLLGIYSYLAPVFLVAIWTEPNWHPAGAAGPTAWAALAKERAALYFGHQALHNHDSLTPSTL